MAIVSKKTGLYRTTFAKVIYVNSEDVEKEMNQWLAENEKKVEIVDIKLTSCYFRDLQTKTIVLILYKNKTSDNQ